MSRTYRNIPHNRCLRRPKTYSFKRDLVSCEEEIMDELGPNYLKGNFAKISNIVSDRDDIYIGAIDENKPIRVKYGEIYLNKVFGELSKDNFYPPDHTVMFDEQKNVFRAWRAYNCKKVKVNYLPFVITIAKKQYPVKIKIDWWYE